MPRAAASGRLKKLCTVDKGEDSSWGPIPAPSLTPATQRGRQNNGVVYWNWEPSPDDITARGFKYVFPHLSGCFHVQLHRHSVYGRIPGPENRERSRIRSNWGVVYEDSLFGTTQAKYGFEAARKGRDHRGRPIFLTNAKSTDLTPVILRLKSAKPEFPALPRLFHRPGSCSSASPKNWGFDYKIALTTGGLGA